jgi:hypothetical protein
MLLGGGLGLSFREIDELGSQAVWGRCTQNLSRTVWLKKSTWLKIEVLHGERYSIKKWRQGKVRWQNQNDWA